MSSIYPFVRASNFRRLIQQNQNSILTETVTDYGFLAGPVKRVEIPEQKRHLIPDPEFTSGTIIDSELNISPAAHDQKELLKKAGLTINDNSDVKLIRDKKGSLKAAVSITKDKDNKNTINYIDTDQNSDYFKKAIVKMSTTPGGYNLQKKESIIVKEEINPLALAED